MHANIWNIRNCKQRLGILERTYAQKRHLESILLAKSSINSHSTRSAKTSPNLKNNHSKTLPNAPRSHTADQHSRIKQHYTMPKTQLQLSANLNAYSSLNRLIKKREIEQENSKLLVRIFTAAPTLKRKSWIRMQQQNDKYKQNLTKKYRQVDYSAEALKIIRNSPNNQLAHNPKFKLILAPSDRINSPC